MPGLNFLAGLAADNFSKFWVKCKARERGGNVDIRQEQSEVEQVDLV